MCIYIYRERCMMIHMHYHDTLQVVIVATVVIIVLLLGNGLLGGPWAKCMLVKNMFSQALKAM